MTDSKTQKGEKVKERRKQSHTSFTENQPKILIVDDTPGNVILLGRILIDENYQVFIAINGEKALSMAKYYKPDLILLDIIMPNMDGYEVCRRLKAEKKTQDIPVIFITATNKIENELTGFEVGGVDFISKPIQPLLLIKRVQAYLSLKQQRDKLEKLSREHAFSSELQSINNALLKLSLSTLNLADLLYQALTHILSFSLLSKDHTGAIFLAKTEQTAQYDLITTYSNKAHHSSNITQTFHLDRYPGNEAIRRRDVLYICPTEAISTLDRRNLEEIKRNETDRTTTKQYIVPLMLGKKNLGILIIYCPNHHRASKWEKKFLAGIASTLATLVLHSKSQEVLSRVRAEQVKRENFLSAILESALDAIITIDKDGIIHTFNPAAQKLFGYNHEEAIGQPLAELIIPEDQRAAHIKALKSHTDNNCFPEFHPHIKRRLSVTGLQKNGNKINLEVALTAVSYGGQCLFVAFLRDITNKEMMRNALGDTLLVAEQAYRSQQDFLAQMSHEIRTPLNAILGFAGLMAKASLSDKHNQYVNAIVHSGKHLLTVINDILDFSKLKSSKLTLESIPFDLNHLLEYIENMFSVQAKQKNITLSVNRVDQNSQHLIGDPERLKQILFNLLSNALKFTSKGGVKLQVTIEDQTAQEVYFCFEIQDSGIGIPKNKIDKLFQPFTQVDRSISRRFGGTGLGLAISSHLVQMMGGVISLKSEVDVGSTFHFSIAFSSNASHLQKDEQHVTNAKPWRPDDHYRKDAHILIVDDEKINRFFIAEALKDLGFSNIDDAINGQEALDATEKKVYDLIFMDCHMPELDGLAVTRRIRAREKQNTTLKKQSIIALTADVLPAFRKKCDHAGMDGFLGKPVDSDKLISILIQWIPQDKNKIKASDSALEQTPDSIPSGTEEKKSISQEKTPDKTKTSSSKEKKDSTISEKKEPLIPPDRQAFQSLAERMGKERMGILSQVFFKEIQNKLSLLEQHIHNRDAESLRKTAHAFKGICGTTGAITMANLCFELQKKGEEKTFDNAQELLVKLREESVTFQLTIQQVLGNLQ
ncbi:response regulator [Magnetococcales bacterium HHB-1]